MLLIVLAVIAGRYRLRAKTPWGDFELKPSAKAPSELESAPKEAEQNEWVREGESAPCVAGLRVD